MSYIRPGALYLIHRLMVQPKKKKKKKKKKKAEINSI